MKYLLKVIFRHELLVFLRFVSVYLPIALVVIAVNRDNTACADFRIEAIRLKTLHAALVPSRVIILCSKISQFRFHIGRDNGPGRIESLDDGDALIGRCGSCFITDAP